MECKTYFDDVATQWDSMRKGFFSEDIREKAFSVVCIESGKVCADIGAGTGFITEGIIQKGLKVIAVDQSEEMLSQMKQKFSDCDLIDYRQGVAENLPIVDDSVDFVFANMFLHHVEDPALAIKEMVRVLKPGGKIAITDLDKHNYEFLKTEHFDRWMGFKREDIQNWLLLDGLKNVSVDCAGGNCCATSTCECSDVSISIFVATGEKQN
jgi:ubiquinone/menaquinone biosynthesis C-methylase UbiE